MRFKVEMDTTDDPRIYKRARKKYLEACGSIACSFCPYHRLENCERIGRKNWKFKRRTQYK